MSKYRIGIDIGGMSFKIGIVDENGNIAFRDVLKVTTNNSQEEMIELLANKVNDLIKTNNVSKDDILGIGIGCPGSINSNTGVCDYSNNLKWENLPVVEIIEKITNIKCKITNDANAATLGEVKFGCGLGYKNVIMLTLGTGVGGGIVLNGTLYEGNEGKGAELGHAIIKVNGKRCTCGRKGCLEAYASTSALIKDTKRLVSQNKQSKLWTELKDLNLINGKYIFEYAKQGDEVAVKALDNYINYLKEGILNYCNIFRPELIILGGGISAQEDYILSRLIPLLEKEYYGFKNTPKVEIKCAKLGNDAGIIGAAYLI